jgi:hypothetical protein
MFNDMMYKFRSYKAHYWTESKVTFAFDLKLNQTMLSPATFIRRHL